jgi:hypothetical protein
LHPRSQLLTGKYVDHDFSLPATRWPREGRQRNAGQIEQQNP